MKVLQACTFAACAGIALSHPVAKRQAIDDGIILNYALTLEYLEAEFYKEALANYTEADFEAAGFPGVRQNIVEVAADEATHATFLAGALTAAGIVATSPCVYSFPATTVTEFLALAQAIEGVGVSAYLGAAGLISNKDYLTAAGSILTVEARHNTYLLGANKGNPIPGAFDTPLGINEVFTIAAQFIVSCPASNPALPVKAFPTLAVAGSPAVTAGETIKVSGNWNDGTFAVVIAGLSTYPVPIVNNQFVFPETTVTGQVYLVLSKNGTVSDDQVIAGPAILAST